jgi:hypothetical protein
MTMNGLNTLHDMINMIGRARLSSTSLSSSRGEGGGGGALSHDCRTKDELHLSGHLLPNQLQGMRIGRRDGADSVHEGAHEGWQAQQ